MENKELHLKHPNKKDKNKKITPKAQDIQSTHKFEKPTEPVVREVKIKQSMTVAELASQMALKNSASSFILAEKHYLPLFVRCLPFVPHGDCISSYIY